MRAKIPLDTLFPGMPGEALDLLDRMLEINPTSRIKVDEALNHPFLEAMHDEEDEPEFDGGIDFTFEEDTTLTLEKLKRLILL